MRQVPALETERLILREIHRGDVNDIAEIYSHRDMFLYTNTDVDLSVNPYDRAMNIIESWRNDETQMCWGIELKNVKTLIGRVYLYDFFGDEHIGYRVDIGYSVSHTFQGSGFATEAVKRVIGYGFESLNIRRFQAEIMPENAASIKVCEKLGFTDEGVLRKYALYNHNGHCFRDIVMMALVQ